MKRKKIQSTYIQVRSRLICLGFVHKLMKNSHNLKSMGNKNHLLTKLRRCINKHPTPCLYVPFAWVVSILGGHDHPYPHELLSSLAPPINNCFYSIKWVSSSKLQAFVRVQKQELRSHQINNTRILSLYLNSHQLCIKAIEFLRLYLVGLSHTQYVHSGISKIQSTCVCVCVCNSFEKDTFISCV